MDHQYRIIASGAGWAAETARATLKFAGRDAVSFLQSLMTNDVTRLARGTGVYAAYLTPIGRMVCDIELLHRGDAILGLVPAGLGAELAARFDSLIFSEDLIVTDVTGEWAQLIVTGNDASRTLGQALGCDVAALDALVELEQIDWRNGFIVRAGASPFPMFKIMVPATERDVVIESLGHVGAISLTSDLLTALRIEAGRPEWGVDLSTDIIPLEAGLLDRAISTTKGCYVGQEIVIRILHRGGGKVAKRLATIAFDPATTAVPPAGTVIRINDKEVGHLTSAAYSPGQKRVIALGYVHRDAAEEGKTLMAGAAAGEITGFAR